MNILYCISDHGYGHATRAIPIITALNAYVFVRNKSAVHILKKETNATIIEEENDVGVTQKKDSYDVDKKTSRKNVTAWLESWDDEVSKIETLIKEHKIDLILSDSSPIPFLAAHNASIPSIFIGTFTWLEIYEHINILDNKQYMQLLEAYNYANEGIILPLASPCKGITKQTKVGLVVRNVERVLDPVPNSIFYSIGASMLGAEAWIADSFSGTMFISTFVENPPVKNAIRIDPNISALEYVNAASLIIGKSGYGIVSEAITCQKPILILKRNGFLDDETICNAVEELGIGRTVTEEELPHILTDNVFAETEELQNAYKALPELYTTDGVEEAIKIIEGHL